MRKLLTPILLLTVCCGTAHAEYYLFEKEQTAKKVQEDLPFGYKDLGEYWELGKFKDKSDALSFQNEFLVRFGFTPKVGHFKNDKIFEDYVRLKQVDTIVNLLRDLELLKRKIKAVKDPRFNSCYFINRINALERCILEKYDLKANFPRLVEKIYYKKGVCGNVEPANGLIAKEIVAEDMKKIIDKYSVYENIKHRLEEILNEVYSTF